MTVSREEARRLLANPAQANQQLITWYEQRLASPGVNWGIPLIDRNVPPLHSGEMAMIAGLSSHMKSTLLNYLAVRTARDIVARGAESKEAVVMVSWEESREEKTAARMASDKITRADLAWGRASLDDLRQQVSAMQLPIWTIGHSTVERTPSLRMYLDVVLEAIRTMETDYGVRPIMVTLDYIQLIPVKDISEKVQQVDRAPSLVKELALQAGAVVYCAVQAKTTVAQRDNKIPQPYDGQWGASTTQDADAFWGVWYPSKNHIIGETLKLREKEVEVSRSLLLLQLGKFRNGPANLLFPLYVDPARMTLRAMELTDHEERLWCPK